MHLSLHLQQKIMEYMGIIVILFVCIAIQIFIVCVCVYVCMHICMCVCVCVCVCVHMCVNTVSGYLVIAIISIRNLLLNILLSTHMLFYKEAMYLYTQAPLSGDFSRHDKITSCLYIFPC